MGKNDYKLWADEEYEKYLKNPNRIEIPSPLDVTPDEVKQAQSDGRRDGLFIERMKEMQNEKSGKHGKKEVEYFDEDNNNNSSFSETDYEIFENSTTSFRITGGVLFISGFAGCGYVTVNHDGGLWTGLFGPLLFFGLLILGAGMLFSRN